MKLMRFFAPLCLFSFAMVNTTAALAVTPELPTFDAHSLSQLKSSKLKINFVAGKQDLGAFHKIYLLEPSIDFRKNWQRDQRRDSIDRRGVSEQDMTRIKTDLATEFSDIMRSNLSDQGYQLSTEIDDDTLIIRPAIINLDIVAPDTDYAGRVRNYTNTAGEMTLYLEFFQPHSADLIATASERRRDPQFSNYYTWTNSVTNRAAAQRIIQSWAKMLLKQLAEKNMGKQAVNSGAAHPR